LHRGPLVVYHRAITDAYGAYQGRAPGARLAFKNETLPSRRLSSHWDMPRASSAKTTSVTAEYLPTNHGFDEFYGNLYHLNAEQEPEMPYWPKDDLTFLKVYHVRGVLHSWALPDGTQKIEDTGPLTIKRMETIDDETSNAAMAFISKQSKAGKPFFVWMNFTRMHIFTYIRLEYHEKSGMPGNEYADGMWEHDQDVGKLLKQLDDLGIAKDTIVIYTTDNGPNMFSWPDAAMTPFRSEKDSNWEGAFRVPAVVRWPGQIKPNTWSNEMVSGLDWFPTLLAAAGDTTVTQRLLKGWAPTAGGYVHKVHLDGYNILPYLKGQEAHAPRKDFFISTTMASL
jgi:arylsulfatase A-like enzyme